MVICLTSGLQMTQLGLPPKRVSLASASPTVLDTDSFPGNTRCGPYTSPCYCLTQLLALTLVLVDVAPEMPDALALHPQARLVVHRQIRYHQPLLAAKHRPTVPHVRHEHLLVHLQHHDHARTMFSKLMSNSAPYLH